MALVGMAFWLHTDTSTLGLVDENFLPASQASFSETSRPWRTPHHSCDLFIATRLGGDTRERGGRGLVAAGRSGLRPRRRRGWRPRRRGASAGGSAGARLLLVMRNAAKVSSGLRGGSRLPQPAARERAVGAPSRAMGIPPSRLLRRNTGDARASQID